ncbi:3-oxo-tetronate kinase [Rhizobium rhizogenes]|uniref:3-oxo-tetronate kinase n=1 Tax=Rhizobium rhizogenes TaxID=359 RepID=UPI001573A608|nr:3-oxo-tetronate kinase [Rhizobium rhizogenes]NTH21840.1 four-carbon acid sugar kinase family protein [Rhizobium rhizogenes]NTH34983.1 four-carbon acid sugar kinase family protein [Rhizobium rhizogenes]
MKRKLGCIADDFTGATDLAGTLAKEGLRTALIIGVADISPPDDIDAIVVALKTRTASAEDAVAQSVRALKFLEGQDVTQVYFKYCSTFDSTRKGNIGPVADALLQALGSRFSVMCPAFPATGRTVYKSHLFVGDLLLNESGMRHHPLTPMHDSNLVRLLQSQTNHKVNPVTYDVVRRGASDIASRFEELKRDGCAYAVADAIEDDDLVSLGKACSSLPLVTGASGLAMGIARDMLEEEGRPEQRHSRARGDRNSPRSLPKVGGMRAVIAGSCSNATQQQVGLMRTHHPSYRVGAVELARGDDVVGAALDWAADHVSDGPLLIYATESPDVVNKIQAEIGVEIAGQLVEDALSSIAKGLVALGVRQIVVAGGETSGAVVTALGVDGLLIGPEIDPGVPWTATLPSETHPPLALALKSGNFGSPDIFLNAWELVE